MNKKRIGWLVTMVATALVAVPATAALDIDFGASVRLGDDDDIFLSVSARYFDADRAKVDGLHARLHRPEDVAVAYFIARRANVRVRVVLRGRDRGQSWLQIALDLGLSPDIFYTRLQRDPGPPYGKAYGHWKKRERQGGTTYTLRDDDIRELVVLRMTSDYYGLSPDEVVQRRSRTTGVAVVAEEYRGRHGKPPKGEPAAAPRPSPGKVPGHGSKGKSKG